MPDNQEPSNKDALEQRVGDEKNTADVPTDVDGVKLVEKNIVDNDANTANCSPAPGIQHDEADDNEKINRSMSNLASKLKKAQKLENERAEVGQILQNVVNAQDDRIDSDNPNAKHMTQPPHQARNKDELGNFVAPDETHHLAEEEKMNELLSEKQQARVKELVSSIECVYKHVTAMAAELNSKKREVEQVRQQVNDMSAANAQGQGDSNHEPISIATRVVQQSVIKAEPKTESDLNNGPNPNEQPEEEQIDSRFKHKYVWDKVVSKEEEKYHVRKYDFGKDVNDGEYVQLEKLYFFDGNGDHGNEEDSRVVFFEGKFLELSDTDMTKESFKASLRIYLTWLASKEDVESYCQKVNNNSKEEWKPRWQPQLALDNVKQGYDQQKKADWYRIVQTASSYSWLLPKDKDQANGLGFPPEFGVWVRAKYIFCGEFLEEFELNNFPFDCQDLKIIFRFLNCKRILPLPTKASVLSLSRTRTALADFKMERLVAEFGVSDPDESRGRKIYGEVVVVVKVLRNWWSRADVIVWEGFLTFLALAVFALGPIENPEDGDLGERVNFLMTLILTDIALQQYIRSKMVDSDCPSVLDRFIYTSSLFKVLVLLWVTVPFYPPWETSFLPVAAVSNFWASIGFGIAFFIYLLVSVFFFWSARKEEKKKLTQTVAEIKKLYGDNSLRKRHLQLKLMGHTTKNNENLRMRLESGHDCM